MLLADEKAGQLGCSSPANFVEVLVQVSGLEMRNCIIFNKVLQSIQTLFKSAEQSMYVSEVIWPTKLLAEYLSEERLSIWVITGV